MMTDRTLARSRRSHLKPRPGWSLWPATRPKSRLSARIVDGAALGASCARAWTGGGEPVYLAKLVQGTVCKILGNEEIKPHKVRYYLENRDAEFEQKIAEVLCVWAPNEEAEIGTTPD